jgi:hypothetical protein
VTLAGGLVLGGGLVLLTSTRTTFLALGLSAAVVAIIFLRVARDSGKSDAAGSDDDCSPSEREVPSGVADSPAAAS